LSELNVQFESSNVVIADILTIVFTFSSVWQEASGAGVSKKNKRKRSLPPPMFLNDNIMPVKNSSPVPLPR
jgi:hypothetical protein